MCLSHVLFLRKFDFVALEWERLANFYTDDSSLTVYELLLPEIRQSQCATVLRDLLIMLFQ
jgi:hypothetical protein